MAILLSHLRAVSAGLSVGGPFLVLEEDVDLGLLLAASATRIHVLLKGLPPGWNVLQASVRDGQRRHTHAKHPHQCAPTWRHPSPQFDRCLVRR